MDDGKPGTHFLMPRALLEVAAVASFGAAKYADRGWEAHAPTAQYSKFLGPMLRHILKWMKGEDTDDESGKHHLAHAAWNVLALLELILVEKGVDDRSKL